MKYSLAVKWRKRGGNGGNVAEMAVKWRIAFMSFCNHVIMQRTRISHINHAKICKRGNYWAVKVVSIMPC